MPTCSRGHQLHFISLNLVYYGCTGCTDLAYMRASDRPGKVSMDLFAYCVHADYVSGLEMFYASLDEQNLVLYTC